MNPLVGELHVGSCRQRARQEEGEAVSEHAEFAVNTGQWSRLPPVRANSGQVEEGFQGCFDQGHPGAGDLLSAGGRRLRHQVVAAIQQQPRPVRKASSFGVEVVAERAAAGFGIPEHLDLVV